MISIPRHLLWWRIPARHCSPRSQRRGGNTSFFAGGDAAVIQCFALSGGRQERPDSLNTQPRRR